MSAILMSFTLSVIWVILTAFRYSQSCLTEVANRLLNSIGLRIGQNVNTLWNNPIQVCIAYFNKFLNVEIIRYRYLLYKHPYMGPTKSTYHPLPPPNQSLKSLCFKPFIWRFKSFLLWILSIRLKSGSTESEVCCLVTLIISLAMKLLRW